MKPRHRKNKITPADIPGHMFSGNGQDSVNDKKKLENETKNTVCKHYDMRRNCLSCDRLR